MTAHLPPTPPANRSDKGPGEPAAHKGDPSQANAAHPGKAGSNTGEKGEAGNIKQNTTHTGVKGDR